MRTRICTSICSCVQSHAYMCVFECMRVCMRAARTRKSQQEQSKMVYLLNLYKFVRALYFLNDACMSSDVINGTSSLKFP